MNGEERNQYAIMILGERFTLLSDESDAAISHAAAVVDKSIKDIMQKSNIVDQKRATLLFALRLTNSLSTAEEQLKDCENRVSRVVNTINTILHEQDPLF